MTFLNVSLYLLSCKRVLNTLKINFNFCLIFKKYTKIVGDHIFKRTFKEETILFRNVPNGQDASVLWFIYSLMEDLRVSVFAFFWPVSLKTVNNP